MKKLKYLKLLMIVFTSIVFINNVKAFPEKTGDIFQGEIVSHNNVGFAVKYYGDRGSGTNYNSVVYCTQFGAGTPAGRGLECKPITTDEQKEFNTRMWTQGEAIGVGTIIKNSLNEDGSVSADSYYYAELAINEFLCLNGINTTYTCVSDRYGVSKEKLLGEYYEKYYQAAIANKDKFENGKISFNVGTLNFKLDSNGNYVSEEVTITLPEGYKISSVKITNKQGQSISKVESSLINNKLKITIPKGSVQTNQDVVVNVSASGSFYIAKQYYCHHATNSYVISDRPEATLEEKIASAIQSYGPNGAEVAVQMMTPNTFDTISRDVSNTISGKIPEEKTSLTIKKYGLGINGIEYLLKDVKFTLYQTNNCSGDGIDSDLTGINGEVKFENLIVGSTYYFKETSPLSGYIIDNKCYAFVAEKNMERYDVINKQTVIKIEKVKEDGETALAGATLQILDADKKEISCKILDKNNKENNLEICSWVSNTNETKIVGLSTEKLYYLKEIKSPSGYKLNTEMIAFKIDSTGKTILLDQNKNFGEIKSVDKIKISNEQIKINLEIIKVDSETENAISGAKLHLEDSNGKIVNLCKGSTGVNNAECRWESSNEKYVIEKLPIGIYYLVEDEAPIGYIKQDKKKIELKGDKTVVTYSLENIINEVEFSKIDATTEKELPGATLEIQDKEGNVVKFCTDLEGNKNTECKWVSTNEKHIIKGLPIGTYYLVETIAPDGYVLNKSKVAFEITEKGIDKPVVMKNEITKVEITKVNAVDEKELEGATLQILDADKKEMSCTVKTGIIGTERLEKCTWVSTKEPKVILGLKPGKYYLVETIAPEGYVLNENAVEITVKEDGTSDAVKMINELEVEVPDTLSSRSALLIAIAMFDIALGIGIVTYVKTRKNQ